MWWAKSKELWKDAGNKTFRPAQGGNGLEDHQQKAWRWTFGVIMIWRQFGPPSTRGALVTHYTVIDWNPAVPLNAKAHVPAHLEFANEHLNDSEKVLGESAVVGLNHNQALWHQPDLSCLGEKKCWARFECQTVQAVSKNKDVKLVVTVKTLFLPQILYFHVQNPKMWGMTRGFFLLYFFNCTNMANRMSFRQKFGQLCSRLAELNLWLTVHVVL